MGTCCAPFYANLFLDWWEVAHVYPLQVFQEKVVKGTRFIDDIVFIWSGSKDNCLEFISTLNSNSLNSFLTSQISETPIDFLDLTLMKQGNRISTSLYRKPTATNSVLHYDSFHPDHLKKGIPYGQFLKLKRNCTNDQNKKNTWGSSLTDFKDGATLSILYLLHFRDPRKLIENNFSNQDQKGRNRMWGLLPCITISGRKFIKCWAIVGIYLPQTLGSNLWYQQILTGSCA